MSYGRNAVTIGKGFLTLVLIAVAGGSELSAQVGLSTGVVQVALVARSAPRGMISQVGPAVEMSRAGAVKDADVSVRLSANTAYSLVVVGTEPAATSRLWVRGVDGRFQELTSGTAVTVVRDSRGGGDLERAVSFRTETSQMGQPVQSLPVRYELRVAPTL